MATFKPSAFFPNDTYAFSDSDDETELTNDVGEAMLDRCTQLLEEVESFQSALRRNKLENAVEIRGFLTQVKAEHRIIQGLCLEPSTSATFKKGIDSLNLPYLEAVWKTAKQTTGLVGINKGFSFQEDRQMRPDGTRAKRKKTHVTVDVVAQNGLQWLKVSLLTPRRLLFELAKAGWESADLPSDEEAEDSAILATSELSLTTLAQNLTLAASQTRIQYLHPSVHLILPNLTATPGPITTFLNTLSATGVHLQLGTSPSLLLPPQTLESIVEDLTTPINRRNAPLSNPINLDTTILLALISDISNHLHTPCHPRFHPAILAQLENEATAPMLQTHLWPVLAGRKIVCTPSARARFDEIVDIVGSSTEKTRARIVFGELNTPFSELCEYALPEAGLILPIDTLDDEYEDCSEKPELARRVAGKISAVNRAVFLTAWEKGWTTVTSNRAVQKYIENAVGEEERGPDMYVVGAVRSLAGRERGVEVGSMVEEKE